MLEVSRPPLTFWALLLHILLFTFAFKRLSENAIATGSLPLIKAYFSEVLSESINTGAIFLAISTLLDFFLTKILFGNMGEVTELRTYFFPAAIITCVGLLLLMLVKSITLRVRDKVWPLLTRSVILSESFLIFLASVCLFCL